MCSTCLYYGFRFQDVFKLLVSVFAELGDTANSLFSKRAKIVEIVAKLKCCVIMLDIDCNDVVLDMFNTFFSVVRLASCISCISFGIYMFHCSLQLNP